MANFDSPIRANVRVHDVFMTSVTKFSDSLEMEDRIMVMYSPGTESHLGRVTAWVEDLRPEATFGGVKGANKPSRTQDPNSAVGTMKRVGWEVIDAHLQAFLEKRQVHVGGTLFETWGELDDARRGVLKQFGLRSIEEFLAAPESVMIKIASSMPDVRYWQEKGSKRLKDLASGKTQAEIKARDDEIDQLKTREKARDAELSEMRAMLEQLLNAKLDGSSSDDAKPRRGRPPAVKVDADLTEAA